MQNHYNLLYREEEREMLAQCLDQGVAVIPYSPLAQGYLAGTRRRDTGPATTRAQNAEAREQIYGTDVDLKIIDRVATVAATRDVSPAQVALAWLLQQPAVTAPIVGATRGEHIDDATAATQLTLTTEEITQLEQPYQPRATISE
jgi:1-deoxyxylulose-5-phosphate synthase